MQWKELYWENQLILDLYLQLKSLNVITDQVISYCDQIDKIQNPLK